MGKTRMCSPRTCIPLKRCQSSGRWLRGSHCPNSIASWTEATTNRAPSSAARRSRNSTTSGKLWPVSTWTTGKGNFAGQNAFSAILRRTIESLPPEKSSAGRSNSAATSRMMKIASASSASRPASWTGAAARRSVNISSPLFTPGRERSGSPDELLRFQVAEHAGTRGLNRLPAGGEDQFGCQRRLVGVVDAREAGPLARTRQGIEALHVAGLALFEGGCDVGLHKSNALSLDQLADRIARLPVGRDGR